MTRHSIGLGFDIHRLRPGRRLVLGGVVVPSDAGFDTPSDGDVLCHALMDAVAGALTDGDLGSHFPADSDPAALGAVSIDYVARLRERLDDRGARVEHVDSFVTLGTTRLATHLPEMGEQIAAALGVPPDRVSVKARTNDGLGPEGEGRAASATVVVLLRHDD